MNRQNFLLPLAILLALSGCGGLQLGKGQKKVLLLDYAEGRVSDVAITDRLTGSKEMLFISMPKKSLFLEGYVQGIVSDYDNNPIQGVVVRAVAEGEGAADAGKSGGFQSSSFDPGVSDTNGVYRIRFALPIIDERIDIRGRFLYNPNWEQERINLGRAYQPQLKESPFRLVFEQKKGMLIFAEGVRKVIVKPVVSDQPGKMSGLPGAKAPAKEEGEDKDKKKGEEDDLFKGFGFGPN